MITDLSKFRRISYGDILIAKFKDPLLLKFLQELDHAFHRNGGKIRNILAGQMGEYILTA